MRRDDPAAAAAEVREELDAHFAGTVELLMSRGWSEEAARTEARRRFGDEKRYRVELVRAARHRSVRRRTAETARALLGAVPAACRNTRRAPGMSAAVVLTLALGLGANAAIFGVVDRLLLSPPPHVDRPDEVRRAHRTMEREGNEHVLSAFSYAEVGLLREAWPETPIAAVMNYVPETAGSGADAVRLRVARVDREYFPLLGVRPLLGRGLLPEDHDAGAAVMLLSHAAWQESFGGDPGVLGRRIRAARGEYEVVGVLPPGFRGSHAPAADMWIPLEAEAAAWWGEDWRTAPGALAFQVLARLPAAVSRETWSERAGMALRESASLELLGAEIRSVTTSSLVPGDAPNAGSTIPISRWLVGVSLLVLLVACANTANLFLADAHSRQRETAVRLALGAGAAVLRLELMARALILALIGAGAAALLALWGGQVLDALFTADIEPVARTGTTRLILFTGGLATCAALLAGLLPALRSPRLDLRRTLEGGGRVTGGSGITRRALVGMQLALCMILLVGAGLFVASFRNALGVDLGFAHDLVITLRLERDDGIETPRSLLLQQARESVLTVPGVEAASGTVAVPFTLLYGLSAWQPDGTRVANLHVNAVDGDFFRTMGVPVDRGRGFDDRDLGDGAEPVVVVSRRAAAWLWPGDDPLAHCLHVGENGPCARVIGVAGDHSGTGATGDFASVVAMQAWVPQGFPGTQPPSSLLVRTSMPPARVLADVRRAAAVPGVRYVEAALIGDAVAREMRAWRLGATVFSLFGLIAVLVAATGLYGVLSFEVAQRRREFGIRAALGATRLRVLLPVVRYAAPTVSIGMAAGTIAALMLAGRLGELLFQMDPRNPAILAGAAGVLLLVTGAALLPPAWRAASVDPRESLSAGP